MARRTLNLRMITTSVTIGVFILSVAGLALTGLFVGRALKQAAAPPEGAAAGKTETVNTVLLEKTLKAFEKKTSAPLIGVQGRNPFATPAPVTPAPEPAPAQ